MSKLEKRAKKTKSMWALFKVFLKSIKKYRFAILGSVLLTITSAVLGLFIPKILGEMTTIAVNSYPDLNWSLLGGKALTVIALFVSSGLLSYAQAYILAVVSAKYTKELRERILDKISRLPITLISTNTATHYQGCRTMLISLRLRCRKRLPIFQCRSLPLLE